MKHLRRSIAVIAALALGFSCANPALDADRDLDAKDPAKGSISINLPCLSSAFLALASGSATATATASRAIGQSRAYLVANRARVDFYQSGGTAPFSSLDLPASSNAAVSGGSASVRYKAYLPVGKYTAKVTLFNNANEASSRATVAGMSASFDIASLATTYISVTCLPVDPTTLTEGQDASVSLTPFSENIRTSVITPGGEKWFSFKAASTWARFLATPVSGGTAVPALFVYDAAGTIVGSFTDVGSSKKFLLAGAPCAGYVPTTKDATYYVAAIDAGNVLTEMGSVISGGDNRFLVSLVFPEKDAYENDDLPGAAKEIALGTAQHRSIFPLSDLDCIKFNAMEAKGYDISILSADGTCPDISWNLLDSTNTEVSVSKIYDQYAGLISGCIQWTPPKSGTYTLTISAASGVMGLYDIKVVENKAPLNLAAVWNKDDPCRTLDVYWSPVAHATGYKLYQVTAGSGEEGGGMKGASAKGMEAIEFGSGSMTLKLLYEGAWRGSGNPYSHAGLQPNTSYTYAVSAIIDGVETPISASATKQTKQETVLYVYVN